jgi:hypothetical protein
MLPVGRGLLIVVVLACLVSLPARADAAPIDLGTLSNGEFRISGMFEADNEVALFSFFLPGDAVLSLDFTSLLRVPGQELRGFDAAVTFFGPGSEFDNGFLANALFDAEFGVTSIVDVLSLQPPLLQGTYVMAISQYDNLYDPGLGAFPYADFEYREYTTILYDVPGCSMFLTPTDCRTGTFDARLTVELENVQPVPEPGSLTLLALGSAALLASRGRRSRPRINTVRGK